MESKSGLASGGQFHVDKVLQSSPLISVKTPIDPTEQSALYHFRGHNLQSLPVLV